MNLSVGLRRLDVVVAVVLAGVMLAAGAWRMVPGVVGAVHDDGVYVSTAKSIAAGQGYRLVNLPGEPPQTKYPILYPAVLAIVWMLVPAFPQNAVFMQWTSLTAAAIGVGLAYLFLVRFGYASRAAAGAGALLAALTPMFVYLSTLTMSESVFGLLMVVALWGAERAAIRGPGSRRSQIVTGIGLALPFLCRGFGLAVPAGVGLASLRARRSLMVATATAAAMIGAWMAWSWLALRATPPGVAGYYTNYADSVAATFTVNAPRILAINAMLLLTSTVGLALDGLRRLGPAWSFGLVQVFLVAGLVAWIAIVRDAWRGQILPACLLMYGALAVVWPWPPPRFLVPVLPLLVPIAFSSTGRLVARLPVPIPSAGRAAGVVILAIALAGHVMSLRDVGSLSRAAGYPFDSGVTGQVNVATWAGYRDLFAWIRDHTRDDDVVACGLDTMVYLYTDRQGFRPAVYHPEASYGVPVSPIGAPTEVRDLLIGGGADYLVLVPGYSEHEALARTVTAIQAESPDLLQPVYSGSDARFVVYKVRREQAR